MKELMLLLLIQSIYFAGLEILKPIKKEHLKNQMKNYHLLILLTIMVIGANCGDKDGKYGTVVSFSKDNSIKFPDFELVFTGESDKTSYFDNGNKFTFHYYNFSVTAGSENKTVQWSSGTGEIGPMPFEIGGNKYSIELKYSEGLKKRLDNDELVITKL